MLLATINHRNLLTMEKQLHELSNFLKLDTRLDLKSSALEYVLGLTGSEEGRSLILKHSMILPQIFDLTTDHEEVISRDAFLTVLNLSANNEFVLLFIELDVVPRLLEMLIDSKPHSQTDTICMILSNLTRVEKGSKAFINILNSHDKSITLHQLVDLFDKRDWSKGPMLHYLAPVFSNITQMSSARLLFMDKEVCILPRLLPYMHYKDSLTRRGGVVGLIRNLCFEVGYHSWLLSPDVDILPALLLPLAGPEQFSDEEMDALPLDLQYLPDDKERESDPDIRKMLVESIMKLCCTKEGRQYLRDKQVYLIMRELHQWEKNTGVSQACENVISVLISDEPEPGMENLDQVKIPEDVVTKIASTDTTSNEETAQVWTDDNVIEK